MSKAKPTHMRPILEAAIASGELTFSTRKASRWALVTIDDLTARLAAANADIDRLNQMLRATGYGQGQIDAYDDECEARERAEERLAAAEAELDVERRDRTAAEFEMLADRELLRELYEHEINEYGRWTAGMCQRVCVAAKGGRDEI